MPLALPYGRRINVLNWRGDDGPWNLDVGLPQVIGGRYKGGWTRFKAARAVTSVCGPGRAAGFSGRLPQRHLVHQNSMGGNFDWTKTYLVDLARVGYTNLVTGKLMNGYGETGSDGFEIALPFPQIGMHKCKIVHGPPQYGLGAAGQGNGNVYIDEKGTLTGDRQNDVGDAFYFPDLWKQLVLDFIAARQAGEPWSVYIGDKASHTPITPATRYANTAISWTDSPAFGLDPAATGQAQWLIDESNLTWNAGDAANARATQLQRLRTLRASDDSLKAQIDALDAAGLLDKTMIIVSVDQTDFSGAFRCDGGKGTPHMESNALTLYVRRPVAAGAANYDCDAPVCDMDLAATIRRACGASASPSQDGMSFHDLLTNPTGNFRRASPYFALAANPRGEGLGLQDNAAWGRGIAGTSTAGQEYKWTDYYNTINVGHDAQLNAEMDTIKQAAGYGA